MKEKLKLVKLSGSSELSKDLLLKVNGGKAAPGGCCCCGCQGPSSNNDNWNANVAAGHGCSAGNTMYGCTNASLAEA
ncbi:MAG: hypothetical protein EHM93_06305 [Bacteroidales bacterium]|nr:MAG: hypothetical protein EHM93_06305 [Bacteroidales bacterium]